MHESKSTLTSGPLYLPLIRFMLPVMLAAFLQALYSAVDLIVIGRFISTDPLIVQNATAAVGTGSMIMVLITYIISGLTMGVTVTLGKFIGAKQPKRIRKGLHYMTCTALAAGVLLAFTCFFGGELLASVFTADRASILYAAQYLKGFSADMLVGCTVLMLLGYFNGSGHSKFVMLQGLFSAFCVRIPVVLFLSTRSDVTLVHLGLGCAAASYSSLLLCIGFLVFHRKNKTMK